MLKISNHDMRLLWLQSHGIQKSEKQELDVLQIIKDLGFVQIDSIQNVTRAQHHVLWSRNENYKEHMLDDLLLEKGNIFEHYTHDASVIPVEFYPMWKGSFKRMKDKIDKSSYFNDLLGKEGIDDIVNKIDSNGALCIKDFNKEKEENTLYKATLDYMWYAGELTTSHRNKFIKYYDFKKNVIPNDIFTKTLSEEDQIDLLCTKALNTMSVATAKEIKNFWDTLSIKEVNTWIRNNSENLVEIQRANNMGEFVKSYATLDIQDRLNNLDKSNDSLKIINPFDPTIRDRVRLKNIFDFDYKIEIFVPKAKRVYGYYVYPILEGNKFIGRIELQADRKKKELTVINFWKEDKIIWTDEQHKKLESELSSFAALIDIKNVIWIKKETK